MPWLYFTLWGIERDCVSQIQQNRGDHPAFFKNGKRRSAALPQGLNRLRKNSISQKVRKMDRTRMPLERSAKVG
jgi:hypothetical protein